MTHGDAENERTQAGRTNAGRFLTGILIVVLVVGILLFLVGLLLASDPLFAGEAGAPIMLGLLLVLISVIALVVRR